MISIPETALLQPQRHTLDNGNVLFCLPTETTSMVRIDLLFEAGSCYQPMKLCATMANQLFYQASKRRKAIEVSEFMDYRGIIIERSTDVYQSGISIYSLKKHLPDLVPLLHELLNEPAFDEEDYNVAKKRLRQELLAAAQRSSSVARRMFYNALYGEEHPLGRYATADDVDRLELESIKKFYFERYRLPELTIVMSGGCDSSDISLMNKYFGNAKVDELNEPMSYTDPELVNSGHFSQKIEWAVQSSLRIGRILPIRWDSMEYARFMLLTTALGGYFGSRLMSNIREDKGYTYGIYARTQLYRNSIVFYIITDVSGNDADAAEQEIFNEIRRLQQEPMDDEELDTVRNIMAGDFVRSVDGIFERATRFCDMYGAHIDDKLTDNMRLALATTTPDDIMHLAQKYLLLDQMCICRAGF